MPRLSLAQYLATSLNTVPIAARQKAQNYSIRRSLSIKHLWQSLVSRTSPIKYFLLVEKLHLVPGKLKSSPHCRELNNGPTGDRFMEMVIVLIDRSQASEKLPLQLEPVNIKMTTKMILAGWRHCSCSCCNSCSSCRSGSSGCSCSSVEECQPSNHNFVGLTPAFWRAFSIYFLTF